MERAEIECDDPSVFPIFLSYGYALENGFKAIIIDRDPSLIGREKISDKLSKHDLVALADLALLPSSTSEREPFEMAHTGSDLERTVQCASQARCTC